MDRPVILLRCLQDGDDDEEEGTPETFVYLPLRTLSV